MRIFNVDDYDDGDNDNDVNIGGKDNDIIAVVIF